MLIIASRCQFLAKEKIAIASANGFLDMGFRIGMNNNGDTDILRITQLTSDT